MANALSQERIANLQDVFAMLDRDNNGFINFLEFKDLLISMGKSPTDEDVRRAIKSVDRDEDKRIDFGEFLNIVCKDPRLWEPNNKSEIEQMFDMFDQNKDGFITYEEIRRAMALLNKDEFITYEEIRRAMAATGDQISHQECQEMMEQADTDKDGKLTLEEFKAVMGQCHGPPQEEQQQ